MTNERIFEKTELQHLLMNYIDKNCTIVFSNSIDLLNKSLCDFFKKKPRSAHPKKIGKRLIAAPSIERFPPKVDRH